MIFFEVVATNRWIRFDNALPDEEVVIFLTNF